MRLRPTIAIMVFLACGCVSAGTNFDPVQVRSLQPGMSQADVIASLGKPNAYNYLANGQQVAVWLYSRGTPLGTGNARSVALLFGTDKRLVRVLAQTETEVR